MTLKWNLKGSAFVDVRITRGKKSGEATPRSAHESFDAGPGN